MAFSDPEYISVVIIGGGQAGLAVSHCLRRRGVDDHVIFERGRIGESWRSGRWDSFCLVTPNRQCRLPGHSYEGNEPDGFMTKDEVVGFIEGYAGKFRPPVLEGINVISVTKQDGYFRVLTDQGSWFCDDVIVAIGSYHTPFVPAGADRISDRIRQFTAAEYRNPSQLPEGATLVVGSGQSGVQIMEDLHRAGRKVHLSLGNSPRSPRRYRGRDVASWLEEMDQSGSGAGGEGDPYIGGCGRDGEADLRSFALEGVSLHGSVGEIHLEKVVLRPDAARKLENADASYRSLRRRIDGHIETLGLDAPEEPLYQVEWIPKEDETELVFSEHDITSIVWCTGYLPDFKFIDLPVFNMRGFPETKRGATAIPGLYFLGLPWMHGWGSARFAGIAEDADHVASLIEEGVLQPAGCE